MKLFFLFVASVVVSSVQHTKFCFCFIIPYLIRNAYSGKGRMGNGTKCARKCPLIHSFMFIARNQFFVLLFILLLIISNLAAQVYRYFLRSLPFNSFEEAILCFYRRFLYVKKLNKIFFRCMVCEIYCNRKSDDENQSS